MSYILQKGTYYCVIDDKNAYYSSSLPLHWIIYFSVFIAYHVPLFLSLHISLGASYNFLFLMFPIRTYGISYWRFLLYHK